MAKTKSGKGKMAKDPGALVFRMLQYYFVVALILVGLDKFFYILNNWSIYLSEFLLRMCNCHDRFFMGIIGLIEIAAGIGMAIWPRIFSYVICLFLLGVIVNLLMAGYYYDIIVRDAGLFFASLAVAKLSKKYGK